MQGREWRVVGHLDLFSKVERSLSERTLIASDSFAASAGGSRLQNAQFHLSSAAAIRSGHREPVSQTAPPVAATPGSG